MDAPLAPLTIVSVDGGGYAVVLANLGQQVLIRPVGTISRPPFMPSGEYWAPSPDRLVARADVCPFSFCENDYLPGLILACAGGYAHRYGSRFTNK